LLWFASVGGATAKAVTPTIPKQTTAVNTVFLMVPEKNLELSVIALLVISLQ
jgi:hypothetical protein